MPVKDPSKVVPAAPAESADAALKHIVDGFLRFHTRSSLSSKSCSRSSPPRKTPRDVHHLRRLAHRPELITQSSPGDLFVTRNVGNVVPPYGQMNGGVSSAIEYAVLALGVHHIIICGHSDCGAMRAVLNPQPGQDADGQGLAAPRRSGATMVEDNCPAQ
jgi:carbonic anhydrase